MGLVVDANTHCLCWWTITLLDPGSEMKCPRSAVSVIIKGLRIF